METGVMHTCKSLDMGADIEGVDTAIIMSGDSSNISKKQKIGRAIRFKEGRIGEVFTFVIKGTTEENWFSKSNKDLEFITVQDYHLEDLLKGNELKELPNQNDDVIFTL
jgi:superfamily II DNA or RNA helicase